LNGSKIEDEYILEMWGAGSGAGLVGGQNLVGGAASAGIGYDPDLLLALAGQIRKIKKKKFKPKPIGKVPTVDKLQALVDAILAVKAVKATQYLTGE
jgi:hypothetical protein